MSDAKIVFLWSLAFLALAGVALFFGARPWRSAWWPARW
jgi:hypothetical protein